MALPQYGPSLHLLLLLLHSCCQSAGIAVVTLVFPSQSVSKTPPFKFRFMTHVGEEDIFFSLIRFHY